MSEAAPARLSGARATVLVLLSACCFGSIAIFITIARDAGVDLVDILVWRYGIAAALLVLVSGGIAAVRAHGDRALPLLGFAGGGQALIAFVSLSALEYIPVASLVFLFYTYPAWVAVISAVRGEERLTTTRIAALALSLAGIAAMVGLPGAGGLNTIGVMLALGSALLYALYIPMINHFGAGIPAPVTAGFASTGAFVILLAVALGQDGVRVAMPSAVWVSIALLAVVSTVFAFIAFLRGLAVIGPVRTAIVSTVEPFWTALLGSIVLDQQLGPRTFVGGILIAAAVIVLQLRARARMGTDPA